MIQVTLGQIETSAHTLMGNDGEVSAFTTLRRQRLPVHVADRLGRIADVTDAAFARFHAAKLKLLQVYGEETRPNRWECKPENLAAFHAELNPLRAEVERILVDPLTTGDLGSKAEISEVELRLLRWLFEEARGQEEA